MGIRDASPPCLVLASASPRRRRLLEDRGLTFDVLPSLVDESLPEGVEPLTAARLLARRKADAVCPQGGPVVLAADTLIVAADGEILGKPVDLDDARRMLRKLSGTTHRVISGVCVTFGRPRRVLEESVETLVTMRKMTADEIDTYVASGESEGKAGAYAIQETADRFVTRVAGSWSNVVGLPVECAVRLLQEAGLEVPCVS